MVYNYNEYSKYAFTTPTARIQERAIVQKIMSLLNNDKYNDIDDFIEKTKNLSYNDFLKMLELDNVIKHWGNTLNDNDLKTILENLKKLSEDKKKFDQQDIKTSTIEDKQYFTYEGKDKDYILNNTANTLDPYGEIKNFQNTSQSFQTADSSKNTEAMMNKMEQEKTESIKLQFLNEINAGSLSEEDLEVYNFAKIQELQYGSPFRIDIKERIIVDSNNTVMKIVRQNGILTLLSDKNEKKGKEDQPEKGSQLVFKNTSTTNVTNATSSN